MNAKYTLLRYALLCSGLPLFSVTFCGPVSGQHTQNKVVNQYEAPASVEGMSHYFSRPLEYSRSSIISFLKHTYNSPQYPQYFALNFDHVCQGLSVASHNPHPRRFIRKVLSLFSLKLYSVCVNPYALDGCLRKFVTSCAPHTDTQKEKELFISACKDLIGACLSDEFEQLRTNPDATLHALATKLFELTQAAPDQDITVEELQYAIHYFLTQALRLLVWSPDDQVDTWHIMHSITEQLRSCADHNLIDFEMLDKLYWVVLYQYGHFLSIAGHLLDSSFFDTVSEVLRTHPNGFWHHEECELFMTTKLEYLQRALMQAEAASQLAAEGYLQ